MPLYLPRKFPTQPRGSAKIDWSNPITKNLEVAILHGQQSLPVINLANTKLQFSTSNSSTNFTKNIVGNLVGLGNSFVNSSFTFEAATPINFFNGTPSGFSVGSVCSMSTDGVVANIFNQDRGASSRVFQFRANASNELQFITFTSGGSQSSVVAWPKRRTGSAVIAGASGTSQSIVVDGFLTKKTVTTVDNLSVNEKLDIANFSGTSSPWIGTISLSALWSRRLSDDELVSWSNNPWQIFSLFSFTQLTTGAAPVTAIYEFQTFGRGVGRGIARGIA